jgi:hypothetical protein
MLQNKKVADVYVTENKSSWHICYRIRK